MKAKQVDKLYKELTPCEQAALVVEALARNDHDELKLIIDSLEKNTYRIWNPEYTFRKEGLLSLAWTYGIRYWKERELFMRSMLAFEKGDKNAIYHCLTAAAHISGMEVALKTVCNEIKVDIEAVKTLAECKNQVKMPIQDSLPNILNCSSIW